MYTVREMENENRKIGKQQCAMVTVCYQKSCFHCMVKLISLFKCVSLKQCVLFSFIFEYKRGMQQTTELRRTER